MQKLIKILLVLSLAILSVYSFGSSAETVSQKKQAAPVTVESSTSTTTTTSTSADESDTLTKKLVPNDAKIEAIKTKVKTVYPQIIVDTVSMSPMKGWFEATAGNMVFYVSEDVHHMFVGELLDLTLLESERDLTENVRRKLREKLLSNLNIKDMIVYPVKEGQKKLASVTAFIDSDCGFCHKLHEEARKLADAGIELRYLAFPRAGVGSPTYTRMVSAWCSESRSEALNTLMKGEQIPAKECTNPIAEQFLLGQKLGIAGTPTLFLEDGTMIPGYMPADKLAEEAIKHVKPGSSNKK
jgi:thiol:disulfide interchange protein DsbC